jgi:hypothetical protein
MDNELAIAILVVLSVSACATLTYIAKQAFCNKNPLGEEYVAVEEV